MTTINAGTAFFNAASLEPIAQRATLALFKEMSIALGKLFGGAQQPVGKPFTASMPASGQANIDLGDGATLQINENSSEVKIVSADGHTTDISGDPHVSVDGQHIGDFYGTTTFEMKDGTKITIQTQESKTNPGVYYANTVTVTRGAQAVTINGVSEQSKGDLTVTQGTNGRALDRDTADGLVLKQGAGGTWDTASGSAVTQSDFDLTKGGGEALLELGDELGRELGSFLSFGALGGALNAAAHGHAPEHAHPHEGRRVEDAFLALGLAFASGL